MPISEARAREAMWPEAPRRVANVFGGCRSTTGCTALQWVSAPAGYRVSGKRIPSCFSGASCQISLSKVHSACLRRGPLLRRRMIGVHPSANLESILPFLEPASLGRSNLRPFGTSFSDFFAKMAIPGINGSQTFKPFQTPRKPAGKYSGAPTLK
jgi:hypothetical protein